MEVSVEKMGDAMIPLVLHELELQFPHLPPEGRAYFEKELMNGLQAEIPAVLDKIVPLYTATFTHEEVVELIAFMETPTGRKFTQAQPKLMHEAFQIGLAWGKTTAPALVKGIVGKMIEKGYLPQPDAGDEKRL